MPGVPNYSSLSLGKVFTILFLIHIEVFSLSLNFGEKIEDFLLYLVTPIFVLGP